MPTTWAAEAGPQTPEDARREPSYPDIVIAALGRGITSIVHFTRVGGCKGILSSGVVKARRDLPLDARVKHVYAENAADRSRDLPWHGYINLSVTRISRRMFDFSKREHPGDEWVILHFSPDLLGDPGVVFSTTNNAYENTHRARGTVGFEQLFAPQVPWGHYGSISTRTGRPDNEPTNPQAEVLYPFELTLEHLHTITVGDDDTFETVEAIMVHFPHPADIRIDPEAFK